MLKNDSTFSNDWEYITALTAGLAHEIKNPLSTINMNLQLLQEEWADPKTPKESRTGRKLQTVQNEIQRLTHTLEDFLRFVRSEELTLEATDINTVLGEIAEFVEPELARANIELREQHSADLPKCMADPKLLKQAILNPILNAQQAMPDGGQIILRSSYEDGEVRIDVIDTGRGISEAVRDKVFDVFFTTRQDGVGLGLAMTRRLIEQHSGRVDFHSEPGKGTDFIIRLPAGVDPTEGPAS
jgi:signal transduction histidine kinase